MGPWGTLKQNQLVGQSGFGTPMGSHRSSYLARFLFIAGHDQALQAFVPCIIHMDGAND